MIRILIIALLVGAAAVTTVFLILSGGRPAPAPTPDIIGNASATPKPSPRLVPVPDHDKGTVELSRRFPVVRALPRRTRYWELSIAGEIKDGIIPLNAVVLIGPGQDPRIQAVKQRDYIKQWLASIGQAKGTYYLNVTSKRTGSR